MSLVDYVKSLPTKAAQDGHYDIQTLAGDLIAQCSQKLAVNSVVIPIFQTFNVLLEGDAFESVHGDSTACRR